jgi:hypothetical protein
VAGLVEANCEARLSIKIMNLVWENAPYKGNTLLTLLALADWSNDEGYSWPNLQTLADKSRQSIRSVQYAIEQLSEDGLLTAQLNQGRNTRNEFLINTQKLQVSKTRNLEQANTQFGTGKHAKRDSSIRKNHHEPSENQKPPIVPARRGLTPRQLHNLSKELDRIYTAGVGVSGGQNFDEMALQTACIRLCLPLEIARAAVAESMGKKYNFSYGESA